MQTIIEIFVKNGKKQSFIAKKTIELSAAPCRDVEIGDAVWRDTTKKMVSVVLNLDDNALYIELEPETVVSIEQSRQIYESHGWKILAYKTC